MVVKVSTANGGCKEFKTQDRFFQAVSTTLADRFQSALVAHCHHGTLFEDVGHLTDGPAAQQILEGTYKYPPYLDQATWVLFKESTFTYEALSPTKVATYVTAEDFQHYWQTARERNGLPFRGLHFGDYIAASFCSNLSILHAAKL